ncbi:MAG: hypothetical protein H3C63_09155 [Candidatus Omnitrophica bacterium]|nr:hypothetical protein [Candidatus Omnitrophota bacterium]
MADPFQHGSQNLPPDPAPEPHRFHFEKGEILLLSSLMLLIVIGNILPRLFPDKPAYRIHEKSADCELAGHSGSRNDPPQRPQPGQPRGSDRSARYRAFDG